MTNTTFTYYRRVYEVQFDAATQTGTLNWKDGMYDESVAFYKLNGAVTFRAKGKMANSVNKKMSSNKEAFLKARIEEVYESAEKTEVEEALLTPAETNMNEIEKLEKKISQWWAVSSAALMAGNKESYEAAMEAIASIEKEIELAEEAIEQKAEGKTITVTSRRKGDNEMTEKFWTDTHASSKKDDWETPQLFFEKLHSIYDFTIDVATNGENAKVPNYFTEKENALLQNWEGRVFCNPPYGRELKHWVKKAYEESQKEHNELVMMLIPSRTDTSYWHDYIFGKAEIDFLRGRLKFEVNGKSGQPAPFPSAVIVFKKEEKGLMN